MNTLIQQQVRQLIDEVIAIRRHLHQHPELSFKEYQTAAFVQSKLSEWGIPFEADVAGTGVVALIAPNSECAEGCVALRADMDALPITEATNCAYSSQYEGVMHACGHDVHTAILLGTAKLLHLHQHQLRSAVKLIFQPGEEQLPGGARTMIEAGVLQQPTVREVYALHVHPELEVGKVGFKSGLYMASCDEVYITVKGKGGHAAMPHQNQDPILTSAHIITSLQQIVSRFCPPSIPSVLSFGRIEGLGATNIVPNKVELQGTFRAMDEAWRTRAHALIRQQVTGIAKSMGGEALVTVVKGYPCLENHPVVTRAAREKAVRHFGEAQVVDLPIRLTGEDFAFFLQQVPGTFMRIGTRGEAAATHYPLHHPAFNVDEDAVRVGMEAFLSVLWS